MKVCDRQRLIAWWSGGIASAVACKLAIDEYSKDFDVQIVFIDTKNEHEDTYRFLDDCSKIYGKEIKTIFSDKWDSVEQIWRTRKSLNISMGATCSAEIKKRTRVKYQDVKNDFAQVFGFDFEKSEQKRAINMMKNYPEINPLFPLIDNRLTKNDCINMVNSWGVEIPETYKLGFRNNNCFNTGCVQGGIGYWQKIAREYPDKFDYMANIEREISLDKGEPVTICKDQAEAKKKLLFLKPNPDFPEMGHIGLKKGREPESLIECNGFCSTTEQIDIFDEIINNIRKGDIL